MLSFDQKLLNLGIDQSQYFAGKGENRTTTYFDTLFQRKSGQINLSLQLSSEEL
jgi:hypothetical protein